MVRAHFAAVHGVLFTHDLFHEGMTGLALYGPATILFGNFLSIPDQPRIVDNRRTGLDFQLRLGQEPDDVIAFDEAAIFVKEEAAVEIAIPGDAEVGAALLDRIDRRLTVFFEASDWARRSESCRQAHGGS